MNDRELTILLCEILGSIPGWSWSAAGASYPAGVVGVFYGSIGATPDRAVGVRIYSGDDPLIYSPIRRMQLLVRGARGRPDGADTLASLAFLVLQSKARYRGISRIERNSFGPLGADGNGREERTDNYLIALDNMEAIS